MRFKTPNPLVLIVVYCLLVNLANGQVSQQIAPEWKSHFNATPIIENCVFEREVLSGKGETNLYQFRYQENAFLFRQIRNLGDVSSNNIPVMLGYSGRFGSNCWAIGWTSDAFGVLKLFPNADEIWRKQPKSGDTMLVYAAERQIFAALYYGIGNLNPSTVKWLEETKFIASMVNGQKILGEIVAASNGLPTVLEWRYEDAPDAQFRFVLEYHYQTRYDLSYYPNEIQLFSKSKGEKKMGAAYKIMLMKTSLTPLEEACFDPKKYFVKPISSYPRISTLLYSNNEIYNVSDKAPEQLVLLGMDKSIVSGGGTGSHAILIRFVILTLFVVSVIGLLFFWRQAKQNKK